MEVYSAFYSADGFVYRDVQADIIEEGSYRNILEDHTVYFFGNGMPKCRPILEHPNARFLEDIFPSARFMAELSGQQFQQQQFADLAYTEPFYLKEFLTKPPRPLL